ncbi:MAG TPA: NAD(P)/FAD-dependent oxidoreductase, partial [Candidatus Lokiarchaeia archaeon]|nr:NAD(P)/FAD-dependent oxidoreductase [Candidatus Lokiarchaeia archaeon]
MSQYDVVVVGGGIAGPVAARYAALNHLKVLLVEKRKIPRSKPCSGIQFGYFPKLLGLKIPQDKLCTNVINRVKIHMPSGKTVTAPFKMYNFMRDTFDAWLDTEAAKAGAEFRDNVEWKNFTDEGDHLVVTLVPRGGEPETVEAKYLLAADGLYSKIRQRVRPDDFEKKSTGATLNFYLRCENDGNLKPNVLYQFWNIDFCDLMFAWAYKKSDLWVVGTGYSENIRGHAQAFLEYVQEKYHLQGEIVKKEGYSSAFKLTSDRQVFLGQGNLLFAGDAAGLVDLSRGVGMDGAALSARRAAIALAKSQRTGTPALAI